MNARTQTKVPWPIVRLGDVARTSSGGTPKRSVSSYYHGDIPWVKSGELGDRVVYETEEKISPAALERSSAKLFPKGTLCVALYGATVGKLGILGINAATNQAVCGIFLPESIDTRFAYRILESRRRELVEKGKGGAQPNISQEIIRNLVFPLPPVEEQREIVAEIEKQFTRLDAGVAALRRVQANLKRYRAAVLKAACEGRLVPTEAELAKAEGRSFETGEQLLARILADRRKDWHGRGKYREPAAPEPTIGAEIPDGWAWTGFEQLADGTKNAVKAGPFGSALKKSVYVSDGYKIYGQEQVIRDDPYYGDYFISADTFERLKSCEVKAGDILISLVGTAGKVLVLPKDCAKGIINPRLLKLSLHRLGVNPKFIKIMLESATTRAFFKLAAHGGTMEILNLGILKALPIALPPLVEQTRIVAEVERRLSVIEELETAVAANLQRAAGLRQSILQRAFDGGREFW